MGLPPKSLHGFGAARLILRVREQAAGLGWETVAPLLDRASPMPTAHLRGPVGLQIQFASRSFIDEIAAATGADPVAFRPGRAPLSAPSPISGTRRRLSEPESWPAQLCGAYSTDRPSRHLAPLTTRPSQRDRIRGGPGSYRAQRRDRRGLVIASCRPTGLRPRACTPTEFIAVEPSARRRHPSGSPTRGQ